MRPVPVLSLAVLAVLALAACGADSGNGSGAATVGPGDSGTEQPGTRLTIVLEESGQGAEQTFSLTCDPAGGDHPDPEAACAALEQAGGVGAFAPVPPDVACTEVYGGPQTARVTGVVNGEQVDARFSRVNGCEISRWDALAPLLGSSGGVDT